MYVNMTIVRNACAIIEICRDPSQYNLDNREARSRAVVESLYNIDIELHHTDGIAAQSEPVSSDTLGLGCWGCEGVFGMLKA